MKKKLLALFLCVLFIFLVTLYLFRHNTIIEGGFLLHHSEQQLKKEVCRGLPVTIQNDLPSDGTKVTICIGTIIEK